MPKLTIDGTEIEVPAGITVLQACELAGKEIPRFCYHERLSVAGNCRMCLVEQEKAPKPVASCAMPVADGMVIKTDSPLVKKAREGVMEFLLINHPLDCPICDQGGECDLQDQAVAFGKHSSRYKEGKRAVSDKNFGPLVKTIMTRCIQCTRCVRFATEVAGVEVLGATGRGEHLEITTYVEKTLASELSGNIIDLCPVGALTSKPYAFTARPWELSKTESIDVFDAVGTNIRVDVRGREVLRILPRVHEDVNEEWLADKGRFSYDGLIHQRLDRPYVRAGGKLQPATWQEAFDAIATKVKGADGSKIAAIAGDLCDAESMLALKDLVQSLGSANLDCRQDGAAIDPTARASYLFNSGIAGIDRADAILIVGSNLRWEAPVINARIRKRYLKGGLKTAVIGPTVDLTYPYDHLGHGPDILQQIANGSHPFAEVLKNAKAPMLILGVGALTRGDGGAVLGLARKVAENSNMIRADWNGFNLLHNAAARVGGLELGFVPGANGRDVQGILDGAQKGDIEVVFLLGADEIDTNRLGKAFVVYQGHHGDAGAHRADVILPGAAYTEKDGTYMNTEGRAQLALKAIFPPGEAREDWAILRALSAVLGKPLPYDNLGQLRQRLYQLNARFQRINTIEPGSWQKFGNDAPVDSKPFMPAIANYYMTDPISRASETMAKCTEAFVQPAAEKTGTHG
ncbi:NADH-quinone oxidoreductase subunit NuoG [Dongia soli]|uniref:NADH-quinone oxidoreductase n=1 Tax=Dongia soli TaxID=600628 RepID=A0ABU5EAU2_9PROT|nr:NADH-quinone oxidoreductase subunit NuoG [Dongia soli]MDY0883012.1 NADH-quinone oxidoreductase subunit NuoG [Dongia soli]